MGTNLSSPAVGISFLFCNTCALIGALTGRQYYLPNPPWLTDYFIITDLRHAGAIAGGVAGALLAALLAPRDAQSKRSSVTFLLGLVAFCWLEILLLRAFPAVGGLTTAILLLPWVMVFALTKRSATAKI